MPCARAYSATRSVIWPCARNHGAITSRRAPRRPAAPRPRPDGCGPVANAVAAVQRVVCGELVCHRFGPGVGVRARRSHRGDQHADLGVESRHSRLFEPLAQHMDQPVVLAEHVGLVRRRRRTRRSSPGCRPGRDRRRRAAAGPPPRRGGPSAARRAGSESSARRTRPARRATDAAGGSRSATARAVCRGPRVRAAVRGQDESSHEACSPHSVLAKPCHRPLRGSAPSTGLAVHGAHPIDG